jgi:hypothetical protein
MNLNSLTVQQGAAAGGLIVLLQLIDHLHEATLVNIEKEMGSFAFAMDDGAMQEVEGQTRWMLEPTGQLFMWAIGMLFWLLVAAIVGAIFKRPSPHSIQ